jgi:hypothetical protein
MRRIGAPRGRLRAILAIEVAGVVLAATLFAGLLTLATARYGDSLLRWLTA